MLRFVKLNGTSCAQLLFGCSKAFQRHYTYNTICKQQENIIKRTRIKVRSHWTTATATENYYMNGLCGVQWGVFTLGGGQRQRQKWRQRQLHGMCWIPICDSNGNGKGKLGGVNIYVHCRCRCHCRWCPPVWTLMTEYHFIIILPLPLPSFSVNEP